MLFKSILVFDYGFLFYLKHCDLLIGYGCEYVEIMSQPVIIDLTLLVIRFLSSIFFNYISTGTAKIQHKIAISKLIYLVEDGIYFLNNLCEVHKFIIYFILKVYLNIYEL